MQMAQASEQLNISRGSDGEEKEPQGGSAFQTDFSVTNRLLPSGTACSSGTATLTTLPYKVSTYTSTSPNQSGCTSAPTIQTGWQGYLPSDQGIRVYPQWKFCAMGTEEQGNPSGVQSDHDQISPGVYHQQGWKACVIQDNESLKKSQLAVDQDILDDESDADSSSHSHSSNGDLETIEEPKKPKRTRTAYSNSQLDQLELAFSRSHYPDVFTREDLSNKLNIKEDRIQVWFQNRRARYRKQERTGSVSLRSKYRQKRLQRLQQNHAAAAAMGYYPACGGTPSGGMITSPQPTMSPYMPGFHFPANYTVSGISPSGSKGAAPFSASYVAMNLNANPAGIGQNVGSAYGTLPSNSIIAPVSQK